MAYYDREEVIFRKFNQGGIVKCIMNDQSTFWDVYRFLLRNEYAGAKPNTKLLTSLVLEKIPYAEMQKIVEWFFADRDKKYYYSNSSRRIEGLCDAIGKFAKRWGELPIHVKTFLVVLAALEPQEAALSDYEDYVDEVVATPEFATCSPELKREVMELKERCDSFKSFNAIDFFEDLLKGAVWNEE